jgi:nitroreductase
MLRPRIVNGGAVDRGAAALLHVVAGRQGEKSMDAIQAIRTRRSVRSFLPDPVPPELIAELVRDAACAPYAFVSLPEPWLFTVIAGRERVAGYGERAKAYARDHRPYVRNYEWADRPDFSVFHGAPCVILISGGENNPEARSECDRAGQNLSLSAHARGLGSCWVGSPMLWLRDAGTRAELGIPDGFLPQAAFALGYPTAQPQAPQPLAPRTIWVG